MCRAGQKNMSRIPPQESSTPGGITQCILPRFPEAPPVELTFSRPRGHQLDNKPFISWLPCPASLPHILLGVSWQHLLSEWLVLYPCLWVCFWGT